MINDMNLRYWQSWLASRGTGRAQRCLRRTLGRTTENLETRYRTCWTDHTGLPEIPKSSARCVTFVESHNHWKMKLTDQHSHDQQSENGSRTYHTSAIIKIGTNTRDRCNNNNTEI